MKRWGAALIAASVLVSGCTKDTGSVSESRENPQITTLRALPFGEAGLAVVSEVLMGAGVGVFDDAASVTAGPVMRLLRWQVRNVAVEAANGGGITGEALDGLVPVREGVPPVAYLVAAWVKSFDSAGARFSRDLMGTQDWSSAGRIVFPSLVIALFLADATAGMKPPGAPKAGALAPAGAQAELAAAGAKAAGTSKAGSLTLAGAQGVCSFAATFIQHAIADVAALAKVDTTGGGFFGFLGKIWNTAVDLAAAAVQGLITTFTQPVVNLVTDVFGVLAMVLQLSSFLVKWRADLKAEPTHSSFGVDTQIVTGQFTLTVTQNQPAIPDLIADCAAAFGVDLRTAGSAAGSKITWTAGRNDLATRTTADDTLAPDKTARYRYQNRQEPAELAKSSLSESPALIIKADVHRNDVQKERQLFEHLLLNNIDPSIRPIVESVIAPLRAKADSQLRAITDVNATATTFITYHLPDNKTPTPPPPGTGSGTNSKKAVWPVSCPHPHVILKGFPREGVNPGGPWEFDGAILPDKLTPPGAKTCGYSAWYGPVDPVTKFQQVDQVGLFMMLETEPTPDNARTVIIPGTERAWFDGILKVVVDGHTLGIEIRIHVPGDPEATSIEVAKAVLGLI